MFKLIAKESEQKYINGSDIYAGKWIIGSVAWSLSKTKEEKEKGLDWIVNCKLPGIKSNLGSFASKEDGLKKLQSVFNYWINKAGDNQDV
jgi:hypothetical protein